jgi:hypothetical protein
MCFLVDTATMSTAIGDPTLREFATIDAFYPYYLAQHRNNVCRRLHHLGTAGEYACLALFARSFDPRWLAAAELWAYACAWAGHYFFEENTPATFSWPVWSYRCDHRMFRDTLRGRVPW